MRRALQQYQNFNLEAEVNAASPYRITQMLFEGCIKFLKLSKIAINNKDYEKKSLYISKAEAIIASFAATLKPEYSEELSSNLGALYQYCLELLVDASISMDVSKIDEVEAIICKVKEGWDLIPNEEINKAENFQSSN